MKAPRVQVMAQSIPFPTTAPNGPVESPSDAPLGTLLSGDSLPLPSATVLGLSLLRGLAPGEGQPPHLWLVVMALAGSPPYHPPLPDQRPSLPHPLLLNPKEGC